MFIILFFMLLFLLSMYQNLNTNNINKITQDINIFKISFSKEGKILGIDSGKKKIGKCTGLLMRWMDLLSEIFRQ